MPPLPEQPRPTFSQCSQCSSVSHLSSNLVRETGDREREKKREENSVWFLSQPLDTLSNTGGGGEKWGCTLSTFDRIE